jgi:hypothetical protein
MQLVSIIDGSQLKLYTANGWTHYSDHYVASDKVCAVSCNINTQLDLDRHYSRTIKQPWLIQRCVIHRPLEKYKDQGVSKSIDLDYMGSAEFEFGALPASLVRMSYQLFAYSLTEIPSIKVEVRNRKRSCYVYSRYTGTQLQDYINQVHRLRRHEIRLKEWSKFDEYPEYLKKDSYIRTDLWWDIEHDTFFCFDHVFMKQLPSTLKNSFNVMESAKKFPKEVSNEDNH